MRCEKSCMLDVLSCEGIEVVLTRAARGVDSDAWDTLVNGLGVSFFDEVGSL